MKARLVLIAALLTTGSCAVRAAGAAPAATPAGSATAAERSSVCSGFALELAVDHGGRPFPLAAAQWFARHDHEATVPDAGWHEDGRDDTGAVVRSGTFTLHVLRFTDGTWMVDSGRTC